MVNAMIDFKSKYEKPLVEMLSAVSNLYQHEQQTLSRTLKYAYYLHQLYGGDIDVINVVIIIANHHEANSRDMEIEQYLDLIRKILQKIKLPSTMIKKAISLFSVCIESGNKPSEIEEKILNDVMILKWFGATSLPRHVISAEITRTDLLSNMRNKNKLINELVFPESVLIAEKEVKFSHLFIEIFQQSLAIERIYPGKYILLEGNSGVGKNTQASFLKEKLEKQGQKVLVIDDPSQKFRDIESYWKKTYGTEMIVDRPLFRFYSIIGDRMSQINEEVLKQLENGHYVISVRSFISTLVYQCNNDFERCKVNYIHQFVPRPDIAIIYDTDEETSFRRIMHRASVRRSYDKLTTLRKYRPIFLQVAKSDYLSFPVEIIDATGSIEQIALETYKTISKYLK